VSLVGEDGHPEQLPDWGTPNGEPLPAHRELHNRGIFSEELADLAVRSIRDKRFYVHTHPELISEALTARCTEILAATS
jgi:hypothetical protein